MKNSKKNILIYRLGSLGDTIMVLPCFHQVLTAFPGANIVLLTNKPVASKAAPLEAVLGKDLFFNEIIDYPVGSRNPLLLLKLLFKLRTYKFDCMVNLTAARSEGAAKRDKVFFGLAGIKRMVGFPSEYGDFNLLTDVETGEKEWEAKRIARRIAPMGIPDLSIESNWDLKLTLPETAEAGYQLSKLPKGMKLISLSPGTKMQSKDWTVANWVALIKLLAAALPDWALVIIGAPDEIDAADQCEAAWHKDQVLNICGKVSLRQCAAVLKKTSLFVGHDSGPMHLAGAMGVPIVAVFASINIPRKWFPRGEKNHIIYHKTDCAGCGLTVCTEQKKKCILSITPNEVYGAVMEVIQQL